MQTKPIDPPITCVPPAVAACGAKGCVCALAPLPLEPACQPPARMVCAGANCMCVAPAGQQLVLQPAVPEDGCAVVLSVLVAGVKKALVACWVND